MEVSLKVLAERFPDMQVVEPEKVSIAGTVLRGPKSLPVRFGRH
jgi:cytochrome P450